MSHRLEFGKSALDALAANPQKIIEGKINGSNYRARVAIPDYAGAIARHYSCGGQLDAICHSTSVDFDFRNFGFVCEFDRPIELGLYDQDYTLDDGVREIIHRFGPVIIRNAQIPADSDGEPQRNIFSNLNFHFDRGSNQPTQYSLFTRDPHDPVQRQPRTSSTVFVANIVAHLQYAREQRRRPEDLAWQTRYDIFLKDIKDALHDDVVLEHDWSAPEGTGEISLLHNRTVLHASYYRNTTAKGYPISVRYLQ